MTAKTCQEDFNVLLLIKIKNEKDYFYHWFVTSSCFNAKNNLGGNADSDSQFDHHPNQYPQWHAHPHHHSYPHFSGHRDTFGGKFTPNRNDHPYPDFNRAGNFDSNERISFTPLMRLPVKKILSFLLFILAAFSVFFLTFWGVKKIQYYLSKAAGQPANIAIDATIILGPLNPIWQALAQGGEEKSPFDRIEKDIVDLQPKYIRVDHLYDFYNVVGKENGQLTFRWEELDKIVSQILKTGALPFFSLSYMPTVIAQGGDITAAPVDWNDWSTVVRETIQHYSGQQGFNLKNIIYEVWNEPDLFGNWKIGREKNYQTLYHYAILGANQTKNTNAFEIGGPASTALYQAWVDEFLNYIKKNNLRIDFYSWHRYSLNPEKFLEDVNVVDTWLFQNAGYSLKKYLTEWGSVSENSSYHDSNFDAAHLVATTRQLLQRIDFAFTFEIKDGPDPAGNKYWGRWGLLTHEKTGPIEKKPKYFAFQLLNKMKGEQISLIGEGSWVTGFAAKEVNQIRTILVNFDQNGQHSETVPLTINNLENGTYSYQESFLFGPSKKSKEIVANDNLKKEVFLSPNNIVLIELTKI